MDTPTPRRLAPWILAGLALLAAAAGTAYYQYSASHPSTDDAYVEADIVRISASVPGRILHVAAHPHQRVHRGDPLLEIDPTPYEYAVTEARAHLREALAQNRGARAGIDKLDSQLAENQATLDDARRTLQRTRQLAQSGFLSPAAEDNAQSVVAAKQAATQAALAALQQGLNELGGQGSDNAAVQAAAAQLARAEYDLAQTLVRAPADGTLGDIGVRPGEQVEIGQALFPLVENRRWVTANFKESALARLRPGQAATIRIDSQPDADWQGVVESLSPASGSVFALLPPENASGNWVKVAQRFPVRIHLTGDTRSLPVGASATVTVDTRQAR
jgi:membrane fusion protein (multidrug efflux system)